MLVKIISWIISRVATAAGFLDPAKLMKHMQMFSQPSEVAFPVEIMRFGAAVHARGAINYCAIQHNLDWLWPYWAHQQFSPHSNAFVPRAFTVTHINLTHRNWTAIGVPGYADYPIVDPRGLITPFYDSWSLDAWVIAEDAEPDENLIPSHLKNVEHQPIFRPFFKIRTVSSNEKMKLISTSWVERENQTAIPLLQASFEAFAARKSWLVIALRPYNPEGISAVRDIELLPDKKGWRINNQKNVYFERPCDRHAFSEYQYGDVYGKLTGTDSSGSIKCPVGMATAAALFEIKPGQAQKIMVHIPLEQKENKKKAVFPESSIATAALWNSNVQGATLPRFPSEQFRFLYQASLHNVILHSPREIFPGPFTYKHFWFRDAAMISYAMLCAGLPERVEKVIDAFLSRQKKNGYFHSQEGEWDSNGQVLWIMHKFCQMTGLAPKQSWKKHVIDGADWIPKKRIRGKAEVPHDGLFPAGFSAEYLGLNDFYYWDDFWGVQGLKSAVWLMRKYEETEAANQYESEAQDFLNTIENCLQKTRCDPNSRAMSASPYRRLDSGSIGSLCAGYPLKLWPEYDARLTETIDYLTEKCFVKGVFFQDIAHAGMNPYLTLHMAQNMLRAGDPRYFETIHHLADLATSTGQWPEAIHPMTLGGCMGDGQHTWASAEWIMMMRNLFVREEEGKLILCSGIPNAWLQPGEILSWGPAPTEFGTVHINLQCEEEKITISWNGTWHKAAPEFEIRLPGFKHLKPQNTESSVKLTRVTARLIERPT